jgi:glycine betaine/proline transport system permease protein
MVTLAPAPRPAPAPAPVAQRSGPPLLATRWVQAAVVVVVWIVGYLALKGNQTLALASSDQSWVATKLTDFNNWVGDNQNSNPLFTYFFNPIRSFIDWLVTGVQHLISQPVGTRPLPYVGWLGVLAVIGFAAWVWGNWRVSALAVAGFAFMGLQGLWQQSMDTLSLTLVAVVVSLLIGIPLGVWAGMSRRFEAVITPVLDFMQIMPTYTYLAPLALFFGISPATAVIATFIYSAPPVIRLTAHGIREVPAGAIEASESLGSTSRQRLVKVLLPMARRTIVVGVNQTIMCALAMVTIAALIGAPGLGQVVVQALESLDVGTAANAGLAIVVMAIVLDRVTTAASVHGETFRRTGGGPFGQYRRPATIGGAVLAAVLVYVSYTYVFAAQFPGSTNATQPVGQGIIDGSNSASNWCTRHLSGLTSAITNGVTNHGLNHLQALLDSSPFWLTGIAILAIAFIVGGVRATVWAAICLALIIAIGLWQDAMDTLAATLIGTVAVMALGIVVGVWMGRSQQVDRIIRPVLDALQTMPPFVYLVPFLALFHPTRFTGIVAGILYAAPVAIKIVADGIRTVSPTTVEAARSAGSSTWQVITKVQLPMSTRTLVLATNQGLIYVLSMVVVSGLVGGGALGFDVVQGFTQNAIFGKGLAAGLAIVLLGVMLDRITQGAARRADSSRSARAST